MPRVKKEVSQMQSASPKGKRMMKKSRQSHRGGSQAALGLVASQAEERAGGTRFAVLRIHSVGQRESDLAAAKVEDKRRNQSGCHRNPQQKALSGSRVTVHLFISIDRC